MASLNNMNTVYANEIYMIFSTGRWINSRSKWG